MEELMNFILLISLIGAILQVVLFFKLWRMSNDIHSIANKYVHGSAPMTKSARIKSLKEGKATPETREEMEAWLSGKSIDEEE